MHENELSAAEAAQLLGITESALHRLCNRGTLAYRWFAGRRVINRVVVMELKSSNEYAKRTRRRSFDAQAPLDLGEGK